MIVPPPTPKRPLNAPAAVPTKASLSRRFVSSATAGDTNPPVFSAHDPERLLAPFLAAPERCAVLTDLDGTLAPIVAKPEDAAVPDETRELLAELADRFAVVACVTGRRALEAREMVGAQSVVYLGNQGFEELRPGEDEPLLDPAAGPTGDRAAKFLDGLDAAKLERLGIRRED